jgi:DNA repair exonuclease SbcCD ATPase subunit
MRIKKSLMLAPLFVAGIALLAIACSDDGSDDGDTITSTPIIRTTTSDLPSIQPPANGEANDRDDFVTTIEARLEQLGTQIEDLEAEVDTMTGDEKADAQARLDDLKSRMADLEDQLAHLRSVSDDEAEALMEEIESQVDSAMTEAQSFADELGI